MGAYYAEALGENPIVVKAIREQYRPEGEGAELPETVSSVILSMAIKLDTVMGLFSVGMIPTGSKDPFALRRAVNGIIRMVTAFDLSFDIRKMLLLFKDKYERYDLDALEAFMLERIYKSLDANPSVIAAVLASGERDINEISKKVSALNAVIGRPDSRELFTTFKRVANISSDVDITKELHIDESLLKEEEEKRLYLEFRRIEDEEYADYKERLQRLFSLKDTLDAFFDNVLVNSEDEKLRRNRRNLVASIYRAFREIADIKEISV
jgi:glycyl-tRNA synthetase beta chain